MYAGRLIIGYLFLIILSSLLIYISGFKVLPQFWGALLIYTIVLYLIHLVWYQIRKKTPLGFFHFFIIFLYKSSLLVTLVLVICGSFFGFQNHINPAKLPSYTLTNGEKTIQFQTMSHIASQSFYSQIKKDLFFAKKGGFVLFYEEVQPGNEENKKAFDKALGVDFAPGLYKNLSRLYGVVAQDNNKFLNLVNNKDYNIDLSLDEVMELYKKKIPSGEEKTSILQNKEVIDINTQVFEILSELNDKELAILRYVNQGFLNFMMKHDGLRNTVISTLGNQDIFSVILDDRNKNLVEELIKSDEKSIYVMYGLMHFSGVYKLLQEENSNWKIIQTKEYQVISQKKW